MEDKKPVIVEGVLVIPSECEKRYCWWKEGGQSIYKTLLEIKAPDAVIKDYIGKYETPDSWESWQDLTAKRGFCTL